MDKLPPPLVETRMFKCQNCEGDHDYENPCASCPNGNWGPVFCDERSINAIEIVGRAFKLTPEEEKAVERGVDVPKQRIANFFKEALKRQQEGEAGGEVTPPSALEMAASFTKAMREEAAALFTQDKLDPEEIQKRRDICSGCEMFANGRCKKCGCFLKLKTTMRSQHCPIGKW